MQYDMPTKTRLNKFINDLCSSYVMFDEEDDCDYRIEFKDVYNIWSSTENIHLFLETIVDTYFESRTDYAQEIESLWEDSNEDTETMIQEFVSNLCPLWMMSNSDGQEFLERQEVIEWAQEMMPDMKIKSLKPGILYEACVRSYFGSRMLHDRKSCKRGRRFADGYLDEACGPLRKGLVEIRGSSHLESGTEDEKNLSLIDKFEGNLQNDEWVSVILCGKLTAYSQRLVEKTEIYQDYLDGELETPLTDAQSALYTYWKSLRFNGFFDIDSIFEDDQESGSDSDYVPDDESEEDSEDEIDELVDESIDESENKPDKNDPDYVPSDDEHRTPSPPGQSVARNLEFFFDEED